MKVNIERPTQAEFGKLRTGTVFERGGSVFIKGKDEMPGMVHRAGDHGWATAIYKNGGLMNQGELEDFANDTVVQYVTDITFKLGAK